MRRYRFIINPLYFYHFLEIGDMDLKSIIIHDIVTNSITLWYKIASTKAHIRTSIRRGGAKKKKKTTGTRIYGNRRELDEITGTSAWRQPDPRDGIKFSFGARSRVTNYRYRGLPPSARQIDFRWTFGFPSVACGRRHIVRRAMRTGAQMMVSQTMDS